MGQGKPALPLRPSALMHIPVEVRVRVRVCACIVSLKPKNITSGFDFEFPQG